MFNPIALLKMKKQWEDFSARHPKFALFLMDVVKSKVGVDTIIDIKLTMPDGSVLQSNMKVCEEDMELIQSLIGMAGTQNPNS